MLKVGQVVAYLLPSLAPSGNPGPYTIKHVDTRGTGYLFETDTPYSGRGSNSICGRYSWTVAEATVKILKEPDGSEYKTPKPPKIKRGTVVVDISSTGRPEITQTSCCGVYEISSIARPPENVVLSVYEGYGDEEYNLFVFHDVTSYGNGTKLKNFIRKHKLGKVLTSPSSHNPNTGRYVTVWTWVVNWSNLHKLMREKTLVKNGVRYSKPVIHNEDEDWDDEEDDDN